MEKYTTKKLLQMEQDIQAHWDKTNEVYSLSDYAEVIRELTLREGK